MDDKNESILLEIRDLLKLTAAEQQKLSDEIRVLKHEQRKLIEEIRLNSLALNNLNTRNEIVN